MSELPTNAGGGVEGGWALDMGVDAEFVDVVVCVSLKVLFEVEVNVVMDVFVVEVNVIIELSLSSLSEELEG